MQSSIEKTRFKLKKTYKYKKIVLGGFILGGSGGRAIGYYAAETLLPIGAGMTVEIAILSTGVFLGIVAIGIGCVCLRALMGDKHADRYIGSKEIERSKSKIQTESLKQKPKSLKLELKNRFFL